MNVKAHELTNAVQSADEIFLPDILGVAESINSNSMFSRLDALLIEHLKRRPPVYSRIDGVILHMEKSHDQLRVSELAEMCFKSRRQFERNFLEVAGLPAKLFAEIIRFRRASSMLARSNQPLAEIAANLGYSDQSHFTHEFSRFYGQPPSRVSKDVAFLQDVDPLAVHPSPLTQKIRGDFFF